MKSLSKALGKDGHQLDLIHMLVMLELVSLRCLHCMYGSEFDEQNLDDNQQDESSLKEAPPKDEVEILDQAVDELIEPEPPKLPDCSALT